MNLVIILAYIVIYVMLRSHYGSVLERFRERMSLGEIQSVQKNLQSFLILIIAICQIYAYRMTIFIISLLTNKESSELLDNPLFYCSKTIMIIGFCFSIYMRLKTSQHHGNRVTRTILGNDVPTEMGVSFIGSTIEQDPWRPPTADQIY